jgi:alkanesulfonate monooxygenase SsuD/methylene tetrahydromethanopterin reductase-like flavin-dependent oxidoreductase (luciferase family)
MEFGMFHEFPTLGERSHGDAFGEAMEQVDGAERWGLDAMWLAELHFAPDRSLLAAPLTIAAAIAARTDRMKIGIAVQVLPLGHPLRLAEEAATVDQLSRGRLIFGVGRSGVVRSYDAMGVPYLESRERFSETLEVIVGAWTNERFSHEGKYWRFKDVTVAPRPWQLPHPPIRMAASTGDTYAMIGRMGLPMLLSARHVNWTEIGSQVRQYRAAWTESGRPGKGPVFVSVPTHLAATVERARDEAEESILGFYRYQARLLAESAARAGSVAVERKARAERLRTMTYHQALEGHTLVGTPESVAARLKALDDELELDGIMAELNCGGKIPHAQVMASLKLLCEEVQPRFR